MAITGLVLGTTHLLDPGLCGLRCSGPGSCNPGTVEPPSARHGPLATGPHPNRWTPPAVRVQRRS